MFSIIIPCRNETKTINNTTKKLFKKLNKFNIEIILINDFSEDNTYEELKKIKKKFKFVKIYNNKKKGLGGAINLGIKVSSAKYILIYMADMSDDIEDIKKYFNICLKDQSIDAVFGSRFIKNSKVYKYPLKKLILNRVFNIFVKILFFSNYNDFTNAFKIYKKSVLIKMMPLISENFNIFLEMPLKLISRKYNYKIIPIKWRNRKKGKTKFKINELKSMYLFTLIYCYIENKLLKE
tara:strand:+ start:23 stop:733 length:711 start_codon:yes stop_codon:yes gene_type:complete